MNRTILHSDCNNFYASVEMCRNPALKDKALIVVGDQEARHGIVLAKSYAAKACGIKTGDVIWEAERKCPGIIKVPADFKLYLEYSAAVRAIYEDFTDQVEPFGIDECWLDVTRSRTLFGNGQEIAHLIKERIKKEIGITVSIGVSWNKIYAKLGSDMRKPDAITNITRENYKELVYKLPCEDLLYVGKKTQEKLNKYCIYSIGDLANADEQFLCSKLHKWGSYLITFARGLDQTPVMRSGDAHPIKSIGNSLTNYKDLQNNQEVLALIYLLSESVAARLRESNLGRARTVKLYIRDAHLHSYARQGKLPFPTFASGEIGEFAFNLFKSLYAWGAPIRSVGISVSDFTGLTEQMTASCKGFDLQRAENLEKSIDKIRKKYGNHAIDRAIIQADNELKKANIKDEHVIHPEGYFKK